MVNAPPSRMSAEPRPERRRLRSADPIRALSYWLDTIRRAGRFDALVLADGAGCVVAGAGASAVCDELAAHAPLWAREAPHEGGSVRLDRMSLDGVELLLCGSAGPGSGGARRPGELALAASGCARILGARGA